MVFGLLVSIYEVGGWRLILSIPVMFGGGVTLCSVYDTSAEKELKKQVILELCQACPDLPQAEAMEALQAVRGHEYESNCMRFDVQWAGSVVGSPQRRIEIFATRPSKLTSWTVT